MKTRRCGCRDPLPGHNCPDAARAHRIASIGTELMDRWNHGRTDPSLMAMFGHDTTSGYEFTIERDGQDYTVSITPGERIDLDGNKERRIH